MFSMKQQRCNNNGYSGFSTEIKQDIYKHYVCHGKEARTRSQAFVFIIYGIDYACQVEKTDASAAEITSFFEHKYSLLW